MSSPIRSGRARRAPELTAAAMMVAALVALAGCDLMFAEFRAQASEIWTRSYPLAAGGRVELRNVNGSIEVEPSSGDTVEVRAEKRARGATDADARAALGRIEIVDEAHPNAVRIETRLPRTRAFGRSNASVHYRLTVPAGSTLDVRTVNGSITLTEVSGSLRAHTTNGAIRATRVSGSLEADTTNGAIEAELRAVAHAGLRLETTNGGIALAIPRDTRATIAARVANGRIDVSSLAVAVTGEISRRRLDGTLNGGGVLISLQTTNGGIAVRGTEPGAGTSGTGD